MSTRAQPPVSLTGSRRCVSDRNKRVNENLAYDTLCKVTGFEIGRAKGNQRGNILDYTMNIIAQLRTEQEQLKAERAALQSLKVGQLSFVVHGSQPSIATPKASKRPREASADVELLKSPKSRCLPPLPSVVSPAKVLLPVSEPDLPEAIVRLIGDVAGLPQKTMHLLSQQLGGIANEMRGGLSPCKPSPFTPRPSSPSGLWCVPPHHC